MLDFKPVTLADRDWMYPIIYSENIRNADFSFTNIYAWGESYLAKQTMVDGCLVIYTNEGSESFYSFPVGAESDAKLANVIEKLIAHCEELGEKFIMHAIPAAKTETIERLFPGKFEISPIRDLFDYVYSADKLASLAGKKLHSKRNFVNRFTAEHDWKLVPMTAESSSLWADLTGEWIAEHNESSYDSAFDEARAMRNAMSHFDELKLDGAYLYIGDRPCAFTVGERICRDTYIVHFEKADASITGAYPMINREFVRMIKEKYPEIEYINREDDMGLENLRKAKQSYYPDFMEEKYTAVIV
ncbi:MAG: phosphatidylglycerol lysyltransferase domain-containing protein [Clostridiales bacterium]|nr:phosphatidylglycerol lysyltransferase domain-containing protein [Clostridiales bacterium]